MANLLDVTVSYDEKAETFSVRLRPALELTDREVSQAYEQLWQDVRRFFRLPVDARATLYEAETNRILSRETFRDPCCIPAFPKYWFMRVENGYTNPHPAISDTSFLESFSGPSGDDPYHSLDFSELELLQYSPVDMENDQDYDDNDDELYQSLADLSMDQSPSLDDSREDLAAATLTCNEEGNFGLVLRHFTVIANVPHSDNSDCETASTDSTDSYDVLRMSTLFVMSVNSGGQAELLGVQPGDIVNSINGNRVLGSITTEDIVVLLEESGRSLVLGLSPEKHDDLLFLYPQYLNHEPGEFVSSGSEKIIITDIPVRASSPDSHTSRPNRLRPRPSSVDDTFLHPTGSDSYLLDTTYNIDNGSPLQDGSSMNSLSSEPLNSLNDDDLLIVGDLSEIPVEHSPLTSSIHRISSSGIPHINNSSLEWLSGNEPEWFPDAEDGRNFDSFSYPEPGQGNVSYPGQGPVSYKFGGVGSSKFARRLKGVFQNLTGSSPNSHRKVHKTSSASIIHTSSTSALDRMKVGPTGHTLQGQRSKSTDLGRFKIRKNQHSLETLTKVNSAENLAINGRGYPLLKHHSDENTHKISRNNSIDVPTFEEITSNMQKPSPSNSGSSQGLVSNLGKNLSEDSITGSQTRLLGGTRSYRSQRQKLHHTSSRTSKDAPTKDAPTTPTSTVPSFPAHTTPTRRISNDEVHLHKTGNRHGYKPHRPSRSSIHARSESSDDRNNSGWSQGSGYVEEMPSALSLSLNSCLALPSKESHDDPPKGSHDMSVIPDVSTGQDIAKEQEKQSLIASMDMVAPPPHNQPHPHRPRSAVLGSKMPARRAMSEQPPSIEYGDPTRDRVSSNDPRIRGEMHPTRSRIHRVAKKEPGKFNSIFHGPIHKKQERDNGGRKSSDKSWFSVYAAIEGHFMVFYSSVQDALTGQPLSSEPSFNLHRCNVTPLPNKSRKHVFRLGFSNGVECLIQAESEEAMMRWMRIIHNLNRSRMRMGPVPYHSSTQDDSKLKKGNEKRKMHRIYTPQPSSKHKNSESREDIAKLFDKFKRIHKKRPKDMVDTGDLPCYRTFEVSLEDCPASYDNKSIPLLLMTCVKELERKWLDTEGLYRVAGGITQIRELAAKVNKGRFELIEECCDPNVISSLVKKFLKELPDALIPNTHYDAFIACAKDPEVEKRTQKLNILTDDLPIAHRHVLAFLVRHLNNVEAHKGKNKMSQRNLAIVFGPTVVRKEDSAGLVSDMNATYTIMEILMNNVDELFKDVVHQSLSNGNISPPDQAAMSQGTNFNRRSWDITNSRNVLSLTGDMNSEHPFSMSTEYLNSSQQEPRMAHRKSRITTNTRKLLSSHHEEDTGYHPVSTTRSSLPSSRSLIDVERGRVERKRSYGMAVKDGGISLNVSETNLDGDAPFTHQSLMPSPNILSPTRQSIPSITSPPVNYTPKMSVPEIVGPSSDFSWRDDGDSTNRYYRRSLASPTKRSESRL